MKPYAAPTLPVKGDSDAFYDRSSQATIAAQVKTVVQQAGPIHQDAVVDIVRMAWGFGRSGKKIKQTILDAVPKIPAASRPTLTKAGWLWPAGLSAADWRGFRTSEGSASRRKVARICTEEIANAMEWHLQGAKSLSEEELCREAAGRFGWKSGAGVRKEMARGIAHLVETGRARKKGSTIVIVD